MNRRPVLLAMLVAGALVAFGTSSSVQAGLVQNGSFENTVPGVAPGTYLAIVAPSNNVALPSWSVTGTDLLMHDKSYSEPAPSNVVFNTYNVAPGGGNIGLDITGVGWTPNNAISQTLTTVVGQSYRLTFVLGNATSAANPIYQGVASVSVDVGSTTGLIFNNGLQTVGAVNWATQTYDFVATSTSTVLKFSNNTVNTINYAGLDLVDVELTGVPEPGTIALAFTGLPVFLGMAWFRKRRAAR